MAQPGTGGDRKAGAGRGALAALTMLRKWALSVPVAWWYSITQQLLRISPLLSLPQEHTGLGHHRGWEPTRGAAPPHPHLQLPTATAPRSTPPAPRALLAGALILQQSLGLLLADDGGLHLGGVHVHVQLPPHQEPHGGCELGLCLQHLGGLLLDDEGAGGEQGSGAGGQSCPNPDSTPSSPAGRLSRAGPPPLPGHQGGDDVGDGAVQLRQHLLHRARDRQLLAQVLGPADLLPVLPDDLRQLLAPGGERGSAPCRGSAPHPTPRRYPPALQHIQGALGGAPVPCQLLPTLPLDQLVVQDGRLLLAQQLQRLLMLLSQVLRGRTALRGAGMALRGAGTALRGAGTALWGAGTAALTTRYCCSVWASRCSQASSDAFFCCSVVSRDRRSWGPSWESWENWAGGGSAALGPAPPVPRPHRPPGPPPTLEAHVLLVLDDEVLLRLLQLLELVLRVLRDEPQLLEGLVDLQMLLGHGVHQGAGGRGALHGEHSAWHGDLPHPPWCWGQQGP